MYFTYTWKILKIGSMTPRAPFSTANPYSYNDPLLWLVASAVGAASLTSAVATVLGVQAGTHLLTSFCILTQLSVTPTPFPSVRPFEIGNTSTCFESQHKSQATRGETCRRHRCRWPFRAIPSRFFQGYLRKCKSRDTRTSYVPSDVKMRRDDTKPFVMPREHFTVPEAS